MERRTFVSLGIAAGVSVLAGCTASAFPGNDTSQPTTASPDGDGTPTATASPTQSDPVADCPELADADRTVCAPNETGLLAVRQSTETGTAGDWSLLVTVTNQADVPYGMNPYAWALYRPSGDGWRRIAPDAHIEPWTELAPGKAYTWQLGTADAKATADQRVFVDLDPGKYAFVVTFDGPDRVAAVATFERPD